MFHQHVFVILLWGSLTSPLRDEYIAIHFLICFVCLSVFVFECMYVCVHVFVCVCLCVSVCVFMFTVYVCVCVGGGVLCVLMCVCLFFSFVTVCRTQSISVH